tara:strand:+ start:383 stop:601 length:219 start_codon:yes stop_codon:yes gene_type:complete
MDNLDIFTVPAYKGNAFALKTVEDRCDTLYSAPLLKNDTVDHDQWSVVEDEEIINTVLDSNERTIIWSINYD